MSRLCQTVRVHDCVVCVQFCEICQTPGGSLSYCRCFIQAPWSLRYCVCVCTHMHICKCCCVCVLLRIFNTLPQPLHTHSQILNTVGLRSKEKTQFKWGFCACVCECLLPTLWGHECVHTVTVGICPQGDRVQVRIMKIIIFGSRWQS